jgi:hypothetical protein
LNTGISVQSEYLLVFRLGNQYGNFAFGEYTLALRLTSELVDLRTGYANPYPENRGFSGESIPTDHHKIEKWTP